MLKSRTKQKIRKHAKNIHHLVTGKKPALKRKHAHQVARLFFVLVVSITGTSLAVALAATQPAIDVAVETPLRPGYKLGEPPAPPQPAADQVGIASWYALGLRSPDAFTCASTKYGRGTYLHVTSQRNGKSVTCLVNDYGPEAWTRRAIDLSRGSFSQIENLGRGTVPVEIRVVSGPPQGINIDVNQALGSIMGYSLCQKRFTSQFCEDNRQSLKKLW